MMDPFLDYIKQNLMEDDVDDATCMQQVDDESYRAIFSSFREILGEHSLDAHSTSFDGVFDLHQRPNQQHAMVNPNDGCMSNEPGISLPANCHPRSRFQQERDEIGHTLKPDSDVQGHIMASRHMPLKSTQITTECHATKSVMYNSGFGLNYSEAGGFSSSNCDTLIQNYHDAIKSNDEVLDTMVSCWGEVAVVEGLHGNRCMGRQEQGNDYFNLPSVDEEFSSKLEEIDLSFKNLKLNDVYTDLYVGEPSSLGSSTGASRDIRHDGCKKKSLGSKLGKMSTTKGLDVREALVSCAQAVAMGEVRRANEILRELRQVYGASANGTALQRIAHFFGKALAVRLTGIGRHHFRAMSHNMPSAVTLGKPSKSAFEVIPFRKVLDYVANQSILKAAEGASRLHIVDYGLMYGTQWPCLINALADREGGPPLLIITAIEFQQPGVNPAKRLEESGWQLVAYAKTCNVPFQYHAIVCNKSEELDVASLNIHEGEVLVVNCIKCLCHLADESVDLAVTDSPRQKLLTSMWSLNPHLLLTAVKNAAHNSTFFVSRFRGALYYSSNLFDMLDTLWGDTPHRCLVERSHFYCDILNVVGLEGEERVYRGESYKQWDARITKAGFEQLPIPPTILCRSRSYVKQHYHKDFHVHDDANGWILLGWKGCTMQAIAAWKCNLV